MDCNKEEAIRAKDIAEKKMQTKDFIGAKKIVLKAQLLFPDLDNISQMLTVCEVHCSAGVSVNGETDLYGILQVEPTADESLIKKQYRKLALLLHPDKNKFAGAEAAFKLIGEANMTLSDPVKRSAYDMKRRSNNRNAPSRQFAQHRNNTAHVRKQARAPNNSSNYSTAHVNGINQQQQPSTISGVGTFWTSCRFCTMKYQYYLNILNKQVRCYNCCQTFIAYDMNAQAVPPSMNSGYSWSHIQTPQQEFPVQHAHNAGLQSNHGNASSSTGFQGNAGGGFTAPQPSSSSGTNTDRGGRSTKKTEDGKLYEEGGAGNNVKFEEEKFKQANKSKRVVKPSASNVSRKRVRKIAESSNSDSTDSEDMVIEEDRNSEEQKAGTAGSHYPRRSTRHKKNVTYNEDEDGSEDGDDFVSPPSLERFQKGGSSCNVGQSDKRFSHKIDNKQKGVPHEENLSNGNKPANKFKMHDSEQGAGEEVKAKAEESSNADSSSKTLPDVGSFSYPDPEFGDFEKNRDASQFAIGQIWAIYDNLDGMPRFYARIANVYSPDFKVRYTWLEHNPIGEAELAWSEAELPIACGNYTLGKTESTQDRLLFSHSISWEKGTSSRKKSYNICPRKGEVWALFKGWDISWSSDAKNHRDYEYEVVEVLSDFAEGTDVVVGHLVRIKGFVCLFMRLKDKEMASLSIPSDEMLRFSHMIPSYRLARGEREGIPEGCFELDSASLPTNLEEAFPAVSHDDESGGFFSKYAADAEKLATGTVKKSAELNDKNVCETEDTSGGLSAKGLRGPCEKHNQASTGEHVAADARKNVETESVAPKHLVDEKVNVEGRNPFAGSAAEHHSPSPPASPSSISFEYRDSEFYDFREERSIEKFQRGQIWALYSDVNEFPNYYGCINSIELEDFKLHVTWLEACSSQKETVRWSEDLPVACGTFKASDDATTFDAVDAFSHLVHVKPSTEKNQYDIFPCIGEVWAMFKNWSVGWTRADLDKCEYDVVEVLEQTSSGVKVLVLAKVNGYRAVFMPESKGGVTTSMEISETERLRFAHRIPAFRLTEERGGKLRGYWELDTASLPEIFLL